MLIQKFKIKSILRIETIQKLLKKKVLLKVLSSSFLSMPVSMLVALITYRVIEPYYMGIWATMIIIETYAKILSLGVINGMNRELPHAMGAGKHDEAIIYAQTALAYNIFATLILWLILPFVITNIEFNKIYIASITVNIIRISLSFYMSYLSGTFRTTNNFNKYSNIQFLMSGVHLILCPLIILFKFEGYLLMQLLLVMINALLLHKYRPLRVLPRFNTSAFIKLAKVGVPLFLMSYAVSFIETIPRLFIIKYGNESLLGLFSPVLLITTSLSLLPNTLGVYYYPKFSYQFGKTGKALDLWKSLSKIFIGSFLILIPFVIICYFLIDEIAKLFPKYADSVPFMKIALFMAPFILGKMGGYLSVILKKVKYLVYYVTLYASFQILSLFFIFSFITNNVLEASIWSIVITYMLLFISSILLNLHLVKKHV